ncbi:NAD-dependent epimerase/dehydratase family protein [bacterium]|nr:NAD-dependent epimerase/dehydratase family protein [bacterium]
MNILITGSGGFIGKNLKEFLSDKFTLLTPRSYELDLCNGFAVKQYFDCNPIDYIIHCASVGGVRGVEDASTTLADNLKMVQNLIDAKSKDTKIILFGSGAMYDKMRDLHKVCESDIGNFIPKDLYGLSKLEISKLVNLRNDILCLNIFGCYGKYEKQTRFPTYAISQNLERKPIIINQNVVFDYLYIEDLCKIVYYFIKNNPQEKIINATPIKSVSLIEIANIVNEIGDYKSEIIIKKDGLNFEYTGNNDVLTKYFFDFTSYETGLKNLYGVLNEIRQLHI